MLPRFLYCSVLPGFPEVWLHTHPLPDYFPADMDTIVPAKYTVRTMRASPPMNDDSHHVSCADARVPAVRLGPPGVVLSGCSTATGVRAGICFLFVVPFLLYCEGRPYPRSTCL